MQKSLFVLTMFMHLFINCSSKQLISGKICDNSNKEPITYATVYTKTGASITNSKGIFQIELNNIDNCDSIYINCIGFYDKSYSLKDFIEKHLDTIFLMPRSYEMSDIIITDRKYRKTKLGNIKKKATGFYYVKEMRQVAMYISNLNNENHIIQFVYLYVTDLGSIKKQIGLKIFSSIKDSVYPDEPILHENIIITGNFANEWIKVDLRTHHIKIPDSGCFIIIAPLQPQEEVLTINFNKESKAKCLFGLGFNYNQKYVENTWEFDLYGGNKWTVDSDEKNVLEGAAMIYIETKKYD